MLFFSCGRRSGNFASKQNLEPGSWNFASGDEQNIPDHKNISKQTALLASGFKADWIFDSVIGIIKE
jgi:hypothetical protein